MSEEKRVEITEGAGPTWEEIARSGRSTSVNVYTLPMVSTGEDGATESPRAEAPGNH